MAVHFAFRRTDVPSEHSVVVFGVYLRHDGRNIPFEDFSAFVAEHVHDQVVGVHHYAQPSVVARNHYHCRIGIFLVFGAVLIDLVRLFYVLEDGIGLLEILDVVAFLVGDFQKEFAVYGQQMNAVRVGGNYGLKRGLQLVFAAGYQGSQVLEPTDVWVRVHYESPELNVMVSAALDVFFELN